MRNARSFMAAVAIILFLGLAPAVAQSCYTSSDMDAASRTAMESAVRQYFQSAQAGGAALQSSAEFDVSDVIAANKEIFAGQPTIRSAYLLDNTQPSGQRAEFFCGIYNSPDRVAFVFNALPAGKYGIVIEDVTGKIPATVSWVLHQAGNAQWKIAGLFAKPSQLAGHDANWYVSQARTYKAKGQTRNAWFYYLMAFDLMKPLGAMTTPQLDKLYDEAQAVVPRDLPANGQATDLAGTGRTYKLTAMFPYAVGDNLDLIVKYSTPDISDSNKTFQDNVAMVKALVAKYPEIRDGFVAVVARAVAPNGQDYGTPLSLKDLK